MTDFDELAQGWDADPRRTERARRAADAIAAAVPVQDTMRVLEYGAGTGLLGLALAGRVRELVMLDSSAGMVEVARSRIAESGLSSVSAELGDLTVAPWAGEPFDLVVSLMALHHVPDVCLLLRRLSEATRPGGWIAVLDLEPEGGDYHDPGFEGHHGFSRGTLRRAFAAAGYARVTVRNALTTEREIDGQLRRFGVFLATAQRETPPRPDAG
ncbi:MAG: class I SAM-dependent methyltransferase [Micropruina sp.]|uniref:class I SAM-dependent methyltransferase n=1 Tax=Micropruina sp. TaxID=2737536 RepID=UPI0039E34AA7